MYQKRNNIYELLSLFLKNYETRIYLRQISKLSKIPLKTTQNILAELEKSKILNSKTEGKNKYFSLNLENILTKLYLLQTEINRTKSFIETYPQFKLFIKSLNNNTPTILFGSLAKFKANKDSDVDLLIISEKEQKILEDFMPNKMHIINFSEKSFAKGIKKKNALLKEIEENHIILSNHSYYVDVMWKEYAKQGNNLVF